MLTIHQFSAGHCDAYAAVEGFINFRPEPGAAAQGGRDIVQLWQESAHKMIDAQASLIRRWTGGTSRTKKQE